MSNTTELHRPSVAITGAGSGLGRALTIKLAAKGYRVFGTARSEHHVADLSEVSSGKVALTLTDGHKVHGAYSLAAFTVWASTFDRPRNASRVRP